ncbi:Zn-dependent exopeptidase [Trametes coccinea BRFM310]|uniref:Peptide hydrolase n=1 Tax=Trametes coccinea (strain BRFM310) TaxID=1353009 RepID=A0A1Y2IU60_TRAC3|nr:Zn-dependent exopeptidase [Trametes coccinea BRFM310]
MRFSGLAPYTLLLVSLRDLQAVPAAYEQCLSQSYYGTYGIRRAFVLDRACLEQSFSLTQLGTVVRLQEEEQNLVWVQRRPVDQSLAATKLFDHELSQLVRDLRISATRPSEAWDAAGPAQATLQTPPVQMQVLHRTHDGALLSVSDTALRILDSGLPPYWQYTAFPSSPRPLIPVPRHAKERLRQALARIRFNHVVASIVNGISVHRLQEDVRYLTGEDPASELATRHSFSEDAPRAAAWLKSRFEETGASCDLHYFREGFAPNVICKLTASEDTTETLVLGAHYDDRGSFGSVRAPGANDDASGTAALLAIARTIARRGVVFKANVLLCAFAGEEQGMVGSRAFAEELREKGANVTLMIQADMLAYRVPGERPQLGLNDPSLLGTAELTHILSNVSTIYSPELTVGYFPYPGGSDHQSFHEQGYPAAQVYERAGYTKDPMYHKTGDLSDRDGYDFQQIKSIAMVELATVLHVAGFDLEERDDPDVDPLQ